MSAYERIVAALEARGSIVKPAGQGRVVAQCPAHDDKNPSLGVKAAEGMALIHCRTGCDYRDVLAALDMRTADLYDERRAEYRYESGRVVHRRYDHTGRKKFHQTGDTSRVELYRLERLRQATSGAVFLVEGEKDVHAIEALDAVATSAPMGAANVGKCDLSPLYGRDVIAIADRDLPGRTWALQVRDMLDGKAASLRFGQSAVGNDAADHVAAGYGLKDWEPLDLGPQAEVAAPVELDARHDTASSWRPVDLETILDGSYKPPQPTVGARADGRGLLYPGRVHTIAGESEAGKGWLFVAIVLAELDAGNGVIYLDFEDEQGAVVGRILAAGAKRDALRDRFRYIRPEGPIGAAGNREAFAETMSRIKPTVVLLDGVTEAMGLHGLDPLKNAEVAAFGRMLPRWVAQQGPALLASDHVTKNGEGRGRYAIGAVHKLNAVDGAAYLIDNRKPFGIGMTGRSTLMLAKDRPGALREHAKPSAGGLHWYADLVVTSHDSTFVEVELTTPTAEPPGAFRPTTLMVRVCEALTRAGSPLNVAGIKDRVPGKSAHVTAALAVLVDEGFVVVERGQRTEKLHRLVRPFTGDET